MRELLQAMGTSKHVKLLEDRGSTATHWQHIINKFAHDCYTLVDLLHAHCLGEMCTTNHWTDGCYVFNYGAAWFAHYWR